MRTGGRWSGPFGSYSGPDWPRPGGQFIECNAPNRALEESAAHRCCPQPDQGLALVSFVSSYPMSLAAMLSTSTNRKESAARSRFRRRGLVAANPDIRDIR